MLFDRLRQVILHTLDIDDFELTEETAASAVPGWDSLNHVNLIIQLEKEFGVHFKVSEMAELREPGANVGTLVRLIEKKVGSVEP